MKYRGQYSIKDLRSDSGALGWAHATESAGQYLQDVIPTVCEAQIRGTYRHTSSEDKTDPKKVVTTSFYDNKGRKIATCHSHGDGTWSIVFQKAGKMELKRLEASGPGEGQPELKVTVLELINSQGNIIHCGEMIQKPRACRKVVSENNDETYRAYTSDSTNFPHQSATISLSYPTAQERQSQEVLPNTNHDNNGKYGSKPKKGSGSKETQRLPRAGALPRLPNGGSAELLSAGQQDLASELARSDLKAREQRALFQKLKAMPWEQQERVLERSKAIKSIISAAPSP